MIGDSRRLWVGRGVGGAASRRVQAGTAQRWYSPSAGIASCLFDSPSSCSRGAAFRLPFSRAFFEVADDDRECRFAEISRRFGPRTALALGAPNTSTVGASSAPQCAPKIGPFASEKFLECFVVRCSPISCVFGLTNRCSVFVLRIRLIYRFCRSINKRSTRANLDSCRIFR